MNTKVKKTKANGKQTKKKEQLISASLAEEIRTRVADGTIDVKAYAKEEQDVINAYKEWYDKSINL